MDMKFPIPLLRARPPVFLSWACGPGAALVLTALSAGSIAADTPAPPPPAATVALEKSLDAAIQPAELDAWLKLLAAEPNNVGSPHDKANAEWVRDRFRAWGWQADIETFDVLYPTPTSEALEIVSPVTYRAVLQEPPVEGDASSHRVAKALPAYVAYQGDGDVTAPLIYVNYGMPDDYLALERLGLSVKGHIVIARYGAGWRGLKPKLAQEHGAVGCIIYSDPSGDGYGVDDVYPKGPARPPLGVQRGSVADFSLYPGDPLTPGIGATAGAKRLTRETAPDLLKIPTLPLSYGEARHFLEALGGPVAPPSFRGQLPITYHVGGTGADEPRVHLLVRSDWSLKTIYNVVATLTGSTYPDQWVLRGNHRDGWVFGASDPLSGQVAMLAEAKAIGQLYQQGWKPKRTLVYLSWDAEEPGLIGSTEYVETHAEELKRKAVAYINSDANARGVFSAGGSHDLEHLVTQVANDIADPETGVSVAQRARAYARARAAAPGASANALEIARRVADPARDLPLEALGSGSDFTPFLQHLGIATLDVGYGGEGEWDGIYHSLYDTYEHHTRFVDPGLVYDALLARTAGRLVIRLAESDLPLLRAQPFADAVTGYLAELHKLNDAKREEFETQAALLRDHVYELAADPTKPHANPAALDRVPYIDFAPLDNAVAHLKRAARAYDTAFDQSAAALDEPRKQQLRALLQDIDTTLTSDVGLPGRAWFRNLVYAPGRLTGYGAKTLPGVREALEERHWADADRYSELSAQVLDAYTARLERATALIEGPSGAAVDAPH